MPIYGGPSPIAGGRGEGDRPCPAAEAGVNIEVLYSDHDNQLVVAVDDRRAASPVSAAWMADRTTG